MLAAQDAGATRWESWEFVSREFGIPLADVPGIEEAGMAGRWPPLTFATLEELIPPMLDRVERAAGRDGSAEGVGEPGVLPG